ncbi:MULTISPECIES: hypothetical protein [unclassified Nocardia]|uniref:hypothetical protein n=1 Tax=unclassified Nocardia TaxID=2637762 RepID=UPI0033BF8A8D
MNALRGIVVAAVIGTATLAGGGTALADPAPIGPSPVPPSPCTAHPLLTAWCLLTSGS